MKFTKFFKRVLFLSFFAVLGGCKIPEAQKKIDPLCSSLWYFPDAPAVVVINFTPDGRVLGAIGEKRFFAPVTYHEDGSFTIDSIAVSQLGRTPDFEKPFLAALKKAVYRREKGGKMELFDAEGEKVMVLTPVPKEERR